MLAHGLIRASFVPPGPIQELRDLTRTRKQLMREIVQHKQRIQKVLEDANVKLARWCRMCSARAAGGCLARSSPARRSLAAGGLGRASGWPLPRETLAEALHGKVTAHHRFLLSQHLQMIEHLETNGRGFRGADRGCARALSQAVACAGDHPGS